MNKTTKILAVLAGLVLVKRVVLRNKEINLKINGHDYQNLVQQVSE